MSVRWQRRCREGHRRRWEQSQAWKLDVEWGNVIGEMVGVERGVRSLKEQLLVFDMEHTDTPIRHLYRHLRRPSSKSSRTLFHIFRVLFVKIFTR